MTLWFTSDTHFGHANTFEKFEVFDPNYVCVNPACDAACREREHPKVKMRPFKSVEEMNETMIRNWNACVRPGDHVYHLGDVCMKKEYLALIKHLTGRKRLVRGNHDIFKTREYIAAGFEEIHGVRVLDNLIFTHVPIHPLSLARFDGNVHGHTHNNPSPVGAYVNISVEVTHYRPVNLNEIRRRLAANKTLA